MLLMPKGFCDLGTLQHTQGQPRFVPVEIAGGEQYFDLFTVVAFIDAHHTAT